MNDNERVKLGDALFAHTFSVGSHAMNHWPLKGLVIGDSLVSPGWVFPAHTTTADLPAGVTFKGDPESTRWPIPRLYKQMGVMAVEAAEMDELRAKYPTERGKGPIARHAVALKFGTALVVGAFSIDDSFNTTHESDAELVKIGIGHGDVTAIPGLWLPLHEKFVPAETAQFYGQFAAGDEPPGIPKA